MDSLAEIGSFLKKNYRVYSGDLIDLLQERGFLDLRPSFLDILLYLTEHERGVIKDVGQACGLKKQTMTGHIKALEQRGYIKKNLSQSDKRKQEIVLTEYGQRFKMVLLEVMSELERKYALTFGEVEMDRLLHLLKKFYQSVQVS